ncbi:prolyl 3-hydroxylase 1-like isoform X1 [Biomphalaria pfeifferi]|uniref:procollagen-proline 3-dioxygenase n=1 Tax=Biomphalaria pfeifferi TaxID=112525 RepID=A0AAD8BSZ8_BIOPF|nr:prolyl 3-hydroxylase 1-like isoform X1 [Biomphalaria pfeifferi]
MCVFKPFSAFFVLVVFSSVLVLAADEELQIQEDQVQQSEPQQEIIEVEKLSDKGEETDLDLDLTDIDATAKLGDEVVLQVDEKNNNIAVENADRDQNEDLESLEVEVNNEIQNQNDNQDIDEVKTVLVLQETELSFDKLYLDGVIAYEDQLWYSCASKIERAIKDYKNYKSVLTNCRLNCSKGLRSYKLSNLTVNIPEYASYVKFLTLADCYRRCKNETLKTHPKITKKLETAFELRKPYMYLQYCNYKLDRFSQAASAAYTYYLANPDDPDTTKNIVFYRDTVKVPEDDFIDLEMLPYKEYYIRGLHAYKTEQWKDVIYWIEQCLDDYWKQDEKCNANCDAHGEITSHDFATTVADLIIGLLNCRIQCEDKLSTVYTEPIPFFLRDLYHYLQFSYFQENEFEKSAEAAETFLLFSPSHEVMEKNKEVLQQKLDQIHPDFTPRQDGADYVKRRQETYDFMDFLVKNYKYSDRLDEFDVTEEEQDSRQSSEGQEQASSGKSENWLDKYEKLGMHIIAKSGDLSREERFVIDGLLKENQCTETLNLIQDVIELPSGAYEFNFKLSQKKLLENPSEEFETLLRHLIRAVEYIQHYAQVYRNSEITLFIKKTSIICWKEVEDPDINQNCYPQEDGSCIQFNDFPNNLHPDYFTTVTYLNAVENGDFQFLNENGDVDSSFGVKCGRTVGFNSADRLRVKVPRKGAQRCALVVRYSTHMEDIEVDLHELLRLLHQVDELRYNQTKEDAAVVLKRFKDKGVKVIKTAKDLKGEERFAAEGLATDEQCEILRNVALELGRAGDGYSGVRSPHTTNEIFVGVTLEHFRKSLTVVPASYFGLTTKPTFISPHTKNELLHGISVYKANKLLLDGYVQSYGLRMLLERSEEARLFVEKYFNLTKPLFFEYTHLVCRTAINDSNTDRQDLSHPVHGDNCILQPDGTCTHDFPAFTQRHYSALLYLNSDFEGGEFFFAHPNKTEQVSIHPKCGLLVGFNASSLHGVKAVLKGQRCALAMWYTLNPTFKEITHIQARKLLEEKEAQEKLEKEHDEL